MPASASATDAALMPAALVPASACRISTKMSTAERGYSASRTTPSSASRLTLDISMLRLSGPGLFRSSTENAAMLYL